MRGVGLLCAVAVVCAGVSGCHVTVDAGVVPGTPVIARADLEKQIVQRLRAAAQNPQSVRCGSDLIGEVGKTTRCWLWLSDEHALESIVTVTGVRGTTVEFELKPVPDGDPLPR